MKNMKKFYFLLATLLFTLLIPVCKPSVIQAATINAPKSLTVKQGKNNVLIQWSKVSNAKGYVVYRKNSPSQSWTRLKVVKAPTLKYVDKKVSSGKSYYYTVRAYTTRSGKNTYGAYNKSGKNVVYLKEPKVKATKSATSVTLKWNKTTGASGYEVYRKSGNSGYSKVKTTTALSYKDNTVEPNTKYTYAVRAYKKSGSSVFRSLYYSGQNLVSVKTQAEDAVEPDPVPDINDVVESKVHFSEYGGIIELRNTSETNFYGVGCKVNFYDNNNNIIYRFSNNLVSYFLESKMIDYVDLNLPNNIDFSYYRTELSTNDYYEDTIYKTNSLTKKYINMGNIKVDYDNIQLDVTNTSSELLSVSIKFIVFNNGIPVQVRKATDYLNVKETKTFRVFGIAVNDFPILDNIKTIVWSSYIV